jgi:hypothetical protein
VTRATKAVLAAGLDVRRIEIAKDGSFAVVTGKPILADGDSSVERNEWDEVLTNAANEKRAS